MLHAVQWLHEILPRFTVRLEWLREISVLDMSQKHPDLPRSS